MRGSHAKENSTESTLYDTKPKKNEFYTPKVKESVFPKEPVMQNNEFIENFDWEQKDVLHET